MRAHKPNSGPGPIQVSIRPGKPNKAASGFASGILRDPLAGKPAVCPVSPDAELWLGSPAR